MSTTALIKVTFAGRSDPGTVSVPEVLAGDVKLALYRAAEPTADNIMNVFGSAVVVDGELNQFDGNDWSGQSFVAVFLRVT